MLTTAQPECPDCPPSESRPPREPTATVKAELHAPLGVGMAVMLLSMVLLGGCTPVFARWAMLEMPVFTTGCIRFWIATMLLMVTHRFMPADPRDRVPVARGDWLRLAACALFCVPLNQWFFLDGVRRAGASHAGLLYALNPVFVYLLSLAFGVSRWSNRMALAALIAFAGAALLAVDALQPSGHDRSIVGDGILVLAVFVWALYTVFVGPLGDKYGPVRALTMVMFVGCVLYTPAFLIDGATFVAGGFSPRAWLGFAYITVCTSYLNYLLWFLVLVRLRANRLAVVMNAGPLVAVVASYWLADEPMTRWLLLGAALILTAITLANFDAIRSLLRWDRFGGQAA